LPNVYTDPKPSDLDSNHAEGRQIPIDLSGSTHETPEDILAHYGQEFDRLDTDHDNFLTRQELREGLKFQKWKDREVDELFSLIDLDRDKRVSREEYLNFRGSIVFSAFAFRASRRLSMDSYLLLDPKTRDLLERSNAALYGVVAAPGPEREPTSLAAHEPPPRLSDGRGRPSRLGSGRPSRAVEAAGAGRQAPAATGPDTRVRGPEARGAG
jgi:hypothetical protein